MKKEPQERRNRKELKGFAKFTKKYCSRIGKKGHKVERQLPFHCDPIINEIDETLSPYASREFRALY